MYKSKLLNEFYKSLFSTDFNDYSTATQNMKTDCISEVDNFDDWLNILIETFAEEADVDKQELAGEVHKCSEFLSDLKTEYEDLLELED